MYRGDTSLIEFISAGALTGALYKLDMGMAAILVGAGLGMQYYIIYLFVHSSFSARSSGVRG